MRFRPHQAIELSYIRDVVEIRGGLKIPGEDWHGNWEQERTKIEIKPCPTP
jgi:hypothetical protein